MKHKEVTLSDTKNQTMFELRGRQSVRATFKLSQKAIDALGLVAVHMGIKQKSLFDHIIEDIDALDSLAQTIRMQQFQKISRKQKTFVLSRRTMETLDTISNNYEMPRDALVEYSIKKLEAIIEAEKIKHKERKLLQKELIEHFNKGKALYKKAIHTLGYNDPFCRQLEKSICLCEKIEADLIDFILKSNILEEF